MYSTIVKADGTTRTGLQHAGMHAQVHTHTHAYTHANTHTHTHKLTQTDMLPLTGQHEIKSLPTGNRLVAVQYVTARYIHRT